MNRYCCTQWTMVWSLAVLATSSLGQVPTFSLEITALNGTAMPGVTNLIAEPSDELTVDVFVRNWSGANSARLSAYQFVINPSSYTSGSTGNIFPKSFSFTTNLNGLCTNAGTAGAENTVNAFITTTRNDFVHFGMGPFAAVDSESCGYRYGSAVAVDGPISQLGVKKYLGTVVLKASPDAGGTFTVSLNPAACSLLRAVGVPLGPPAFENVAVTIVPSANLNILSSIPPNLTIDARQNVRPDGTGAAGFSSIDLVFNKATSGLSPADFQIRHDPSGPQPPAIQTLVPNGNVARITLTTFITPGRWTIIEHVDSTPTRTRLGCLPGDITQNRLSRADDDTPTLLAALNDGVQLNPWQFDIDRNDALNLLDLEALMNVFNGAGAIDPPWQGMTLPNP